MIEPWERDWGLLADWGPVPRLQPTFPALLARFREVHPDSPVLVLDDHHLTYGELEARSAVLARHLLDAGIGKGTRVGLLLASDESFLVTWMAVTRIGAVGVTLPTLATAPEIQRIARHADLHLLISLRRYLHHDYAERLSGAFTGVAEAGRPLALSDTPYLRDVWFWGEAPGWAHEVDLSAEPGTSPELLAAIESEVHASDPAGIIYTSGSTAEPKGVVHSQGSFVRQGLKIAASMRYDSDERIFAPMPFFWVGGLISTAMATMVVGARMLASKHAGSELLDFLERERVTSVLAWGHIVRGLVTDPSFAGRDWSAMRKGMMYEALPEHLRPEDPTRLSTPLGMTELAAIFTVLPRDVPEEQRGTVGMPMPGIAARLVNPEDGHVIASWPEDGPVAESQGQVGILWLRSDVMMLGMVKRERGEVFTPDDWYVTGDLCSFRRGHIHFHGRADDMIKAAGANISPTEVESVLLGIEGVATAHVTAVPDEKRGAVVAAAVVPKDGAALTVETIRREAAKALAAYKVPRVVAIIPAESLPKLASSKVDRRGLMQLLEKVHAETA